MKRTITLLASGMDKTALEVDLQNLSRGYRDGPRQPLLVVEKQSVCRRGFVGLWVVDYSGVHYASMVSLLLWDMLLWHTLLWHTFLYSLGCSEACIYCQELSACDLFHQLFRPSTSHHSTSAGSSNHQSAPGFGFSFPYFFKLPPSNL